MLCFIPLHSTSYLQPCDVAVFRNFKSCIQTQATTALARFVINGSFDDIVMNRGWRRQSSAEWASRVTMDFCNKNQAWSTGWGHLRARSDDDFREAVAKTELHATGDVFAKQSEPEPAPEDPVEWGRKSRTTKKTPPCLTAQHRLNLS